MALTTNTGQAEYKNQLGSIFETLQAQRSSLLSMAREVQLAARVLVITEAQRLTAAVGPNDPRVARYNQNGDVILRRINALVVEREIADIRVPSITKAETLLHGRITDEGANAIAHVRVTLVSERGTPVAGVPPVETDDSGYYAIILQPKEIEAIGASRRLTLQVSSDSGKIVPRTAQPFTLTGGKAMVRETQLHASELKKLNLSSPVEVPPPVTRTASHPSDETRVPARKGTKPRSRAKPGAARNIKGRKDKK